MITISKMGMYNGVFFYLFIYFVLCLLPLKFYLLLKSWRYFELLEKKFKTHVVNLYSSKYADDKDLRKFLSYYKIYAIKSTNWFDNKYVICSFEKYYK